MKKSEIKNKIIKDLTKEKDGILYRYLLTESESLKVASFHMPLYSVEIHMTINGVTTENSVNEIFSDIGKALVFFDKISEHLATPIDLPYIVEDYK